MLNWRFCFLLYIYFLIVYVSFGLGKCSKLSVTRDKIELSGSMTLSNNVDIRDSTLESVTTSIQLITSSYTSV